MITIIDYGMGNLASIANMIKKTGGSSIITSDKNKIEKAEKLILPGVGAFDHAVENLKRLDLWEVIRKKALNEKVPIMGICLGMQLLTNGSEEGNLSGLSLINAYTKRFRFSNDKLKIPHIGWNTVILKKKSKLFTGMETQENRFYFVHSYAVECEEENDILTTTCYGYEFVSSFEKDNIIGCQFHPEKSHKFGMKLIENFIKLY